MIPASWVPLIVSAIATPATHPPLAQSTLPLTHPLTQIRIRRKALPIPPSLRRPSKRSSNRPQLHRNTLRLMLSPHSITPRIQQPPIKSSSNGLSRREYRVVICVADADGGVLLIIDHVTWSRGLFTGRLYDLLSYVNRDKSYLNVFRKFYSLRTSSSIINIKYFPKNK
jgi:hypothetical protein